MLVRQPFGIAANGVLFDPDTAEYWHKSDRVLSYQRLRPNIAG
jgi:hypothetical protein